MIYLIFFILLMIVFFYKFGTISYPFLFAVNIFIYLIMFPYVLIYFNVVNFDLSFSYFVNVLSYLFLMLVPIWFLNRWAFNTLEINSFNYLKKNNFLNIFKIIFLILSFTFVGYSIITRNVFSGTNNLFTIVGFDFLLFYYYYFFERRKISMNIFLFFVLFLLFLYAGFRYRLVLLCFPIIFVAFENSNITKKIILSFLSVVFLVSLMIFGQFRAYGDFNLEQSNVNTELNLIVVGSGENIVTETTLVVMDNYYTVEPILFEPYFVSITHLVPSFLFEDKPRASYISIFSNFSHKYEQIGAAMHDIIQPTISGGYLFNHLFYLIHGVYFAFLIRVFYFFNKGNRHIKIMYIILVALIVPSRGYLPQQTLWLLTFILPSILFWFAHEKNPLYRPFK